MATYRLRGDLIKHSGLTVFSLFTLLANGISLCSDKAALYDRNILSLISYICLVTGRNLTGIFYISLVVSLLTYLLAKKELTLDEICSNVITMFGAGVDTVSTINISFIVCLKEINSIKT